MMSNTLHVQTGVAELSGTTLCYEVAGSGHPIFLVHGHLLDRRSWASSFYGEASRVQPDRAGFSK